MSYEDAQATAFARMIIDLAPDQRRLDEAKARVGRWTVLRERDFLRIGYLSAVIAYRAGLIGWVEGARAGIEEGLLLPRGRSHNHAPVDACRGCAMEFLDGLDELLTALRITTTGTGGVK